MRVVTTTCSNTEIVCALGCADSLVGVDEHSDHPPDVVAGLPRVGPDLGVDPAKVAALRPDLVIASLTLPGHEAIVDGLREAGLPVVAPEPTRLAHVPRDIRDIARRLGVPARGEELAGHFERALVPSRPPGGAGARRPRILVEWWPKPVIVPGGESWVTEMIALAGGTNPLGDEPVRSRPLEPGELEELSPDAIAVAWCGIDPAKYRLEVVRNREGVAATPAGRADRIFALPEPFVARPGPRLLEGLERLRAIVGACGPGAAPPRGDGGP